MRDVRIYRNGDTTVAIEGGHMYDGIELIINRYPWVDIDWLVKRDDFYVEDEVKAIVRRHEDDEYNESVANREVMSKLNKKIMQQREKTVELFEKYIIKRMQNPAAKSHNYTIGE